MIGGRFAPLTIISNEDTDIDSMITTFNTAVANIVRRKNRGSLQKFSICAIKGENRERKDLSLKDLRNTSK